jgi:hypothetical protein
MVADMGSGPATSVLAPPASRTLPPVPTGDRRRSLSCWLAWVQQAFRSQPDRGWHSRVVWQRVVSWRLRDVCGLTAEQLRTLELAAVLHDIGRAVDPLDSEPHGFAGARFLDDHGLHDVAPLVAHHSGARLEAMSRGLEHLDRWEAADGRLQALLDLADRTVDSRGTMVSLGERRRDLVDRYGERAPQVERFDLLLPEAQRTEEWLRALRRG